MARSLFDSVYVEERMRSRILANENVEAGVRVMLFGNVKTTVRG